jgi:hypothetical protein
MTHKAVFADEPGRISWQMLLTLVPDPLLWSVGYLHADSGEMATFVARLQPCQLPGRAARQLPDQSTTLRRNPPPPVIRAFGAHGQTPTLWPPAIDRDLLEADTRRVERFRSLLLV